LAQRHNLQPAASLGERLLFAQALKSIPLQTVKDSLVATANNDKRERGLPKRSLAYFVIGLALFSDDSYPEVFRKLGDAQDLLSGQQSSTVVPAVSSLVEGRQRLGYASMKEIFDRAVAPIAVPGQSKNCYFAGLSVISVDGVVLNTPDSEANDAYFGRSASQYGNGAYPQARVVAFVECGTRVLFDFEISDPTIRSEQALAEKLLARTRPGQLLLADRLYCDGKKVRIATTSGAHIIVRAKSDTKLPVEKRLKDGSYLSHLAEGDQRKAASSSQPVRVIEFRITRSASAPLCRLVTTLSSEQATPEQIVELYKERWEWEIVAKELKTVLNRRSDVLRSNTPELVKQEVVGIFLAHFAVRSFIHEAALIADEDVDRFSYKHSINVIKRNCALAGAFPP